MQTFNKTVPITAKPLDKFPGAQHQQAGAKIRLVIGDPQILCSPLEPWSSTRVGVGAVQALALLRGIPSSPTRTVWNVALGGTPLDQSLMFPKPQGPDPPSWGALQGHLQSAHGQATLRTSAVEVGMRLEGHSFKCHLHHFRPRRNLLNTSFSFCSLNFV